MSNNTIEISRVVPIEEWGKIEMAARKAHCTDFNINIRGGKTTITVPNHKTDKIYKNLVKYGVIEVEENIASQ